jgi:hypothetical protein
LVVTLTLMLTMTTVSSSLLASHSQNDRVVASRRRYLTVALKLTRFNNRRVGLYLRELGVIRLQDIPPALHDRPIMYAWDQLMRRRQRVAERRHDVFREIRRQREYVQLMERSEWAKMTRWQRRRNWYVGACLCAHHSLTASLVVHPAIQSWWLPVWFPRRLVAP